MADFSDLFKDLEKEGIEISDQQKRKITQRIEKVLSYEPKVGFFGKTGAGKSSLCNALFGKDVCRISDVEACTRSPQEILLSIGQKGIKLLDVPGVGESNERDEEYEELYNSLLPELDLGLWLLKADDRAFSSDETFYKKVVKPHMDEGKPFFFVLNQIDKIEPFREWDEKKHQPGPKQINNLNRKLEDVASHFQIPASRIIPVSANEKYNLVKLVDEIVFSLPKDKKFTVLRQIEKENQSDEARKDAEKGLLDTVLDGVVKVVETAKKIWDVLTGGGSGGSGGWWPW